MIESRSGKREDSNGDVYWYYEGKLHRDDGPAIELANGVKEWYQHGKRHRTDGPAIDLALSGEYGEWYQNGLKHREDGPAVLLPLEHTQIEEYWVHGEELTKKEFLQYLVKKTTKENLQTELGLKPQSPRLKM